MTPQGIDQTPASGNNAVIPFTFDHKTVRVLDLKGEPWFVARDVASILGYANVVDAIRRHCKAIQNVGDACFAHHTSSDLDPQTLLIPERDVYRLITRSNMPKAEQFEEWVFGEVLPSIRKTGSYGAKPAINVRDHGQLAQITAQLIELNRELSLENEALKPKALFHDAVSASPDDMDIAQVAKVLGTGRGRMFKWLRETGILMSDNMPYQRHVDAFHFIVAQKQRFDQNGESKLYTQTRVTGKGLAYIQKRWSDGNAKD